MAFSAAQNARVQTEIDSNIPQEFLQSDADDICSKLADLLQNQFPTDPQLIAECNGLRLVGRNMDSGDIQPDGYLDSGETIGKFSRGGAGYTQFLSAYVGAFRQCDNDIQTSGSIWNAATWAKALNDTLGDVQSGLKKAVDGATGAIGDSVLNVLKGLWPVIALIVLAIIAIVVIAVVTKGKISVR